MATTSRLYRRRESISRVCTTWGLLLPSSCHPWFVCRSARDGGYHNLWLAVSSGNLLWALLLSAGTTLVEKDKTWKFFFNAVQAESSILPSKPLFLLMSLTTDTTDRQSNQDLGCFVSRKDRQRMVCWFVGLDVVCLCMYSFSFTSTRFGRSHSFA